MNSSSNKLKSILIIVFFITLKMNSPKNTLSPTYKNLKLNQKQSPVELKEKMRKNYKDKVQNCRNMLFNRFRGYMIEEDLRNTLTEIYKSMFDFSEDYMFDQEENKILDDIKTELVKEEMNWWLQEYEKCQMENIDWSTTERDENVICPVCQKNNFLVQNSCVHCTHCNIAIKTNKSLQEIKDNLVNSVEKHNSTCSNEAQFTVLEEINESHVYLICQTCMDMQLLV